MITIDLLVTIILSFVLGFIIGKALMDNRKKNGGEKKEVEDETVQGVSEDF